MSREHKAAVLLFFPAVIPFLPVLQAGFLNWDDDFYLTENRDIVSPEGWSNTLRRFPHDANVYPAVFGVFRFQHGFWGDRPSGYHFVNLLAHGIVTVELYAVLKALGVYGRVAWWSALLFAVHPMQTATVAWVSELKSLLGCLFLFASWRFYLKGGSSPRTRILFDGLSLTCILPAYLSKSSLVVFPVLLLVTDRIRDGRIRRKGTLSVHFVLAVLAGGIYLGREIGPQLSFPERVFLVPRSLFHYLWTWAFPFHLLGVYPKWTPDPAALPNVAAAVMLAIVAGTIFRYRRFVTKDLEMGAALFLIPLSPALGLLRFGYQEHSFVSDHLAYFSISGLSLILASTILGSTNEEGSNREIGSRKTGGFLGKEKFLWFLGLVWGVLTWNQCGIWNSSETFWKSILEGNPECWVAHENLATELDRAGKLQEALGHYQKAVTLKPEEPIGWINLGRNQIRCGLYEEALSSLEKAKKLNPHYRQIDDLLEEARRRLKRGSVMRNRSDPR